MFRFATPVLALAVFASGLRAADDDPKEIVARAIKAHGGAEFLDKHPAARAQNKGKINVPGVGEAEFTQDVSYMLPDKFRDTLELTVAGQKIPVVTVANGKKISIKAGGQDVPVTDDIKTAMNDAMYMIGLIRLTPLLADKKYELNYFGEAKVEEQPALGVRVSAKGHKDITIFFDKKTGYVVKIEQRTVQPGGGNEVNEERIIQGYAKNADGIPIPKKVLVKHDGKLFLEAEMVESKFLEKIDDSEF